MSITQSPVHVAFALDKRFLGYTAIAAISAAKETSNLHVHIMQGGDLGSGVDQLAQLITHHGATPHFYRLDTSTMPELPVSGHVSIATYFRLSIAELLPPTVKRVIYLDGDVMVRRSLKDLFCWPMDASGVAAVPEPHNAVESLGMNPGTPYLNAGVLVLDLDHWRLNNVAAQLREIATKRASCLRFWDQDILALYLQGNWTFLPSHWNVHHRYFFGDNRLPWPSIEPAIIHFSGAGLKPPDYKVLHPYAGEFWQLAKEASRFGLRSATSTEATSPWSIWARRFRLWRSQIKLNGSHAPAQFAVTAHVVLQIGVYFVDKPIITVMMPCYNNSKFILEAVRSVLTQTYRDFELLIVDDASTDRSVALIESCDDSRIRLFKNEKNRGIASVRNQLLALARGKYLTSLDGDDVYRSLEKLARELALMNLPRSTKGPLIVYSDIELIDASGRAISRASSSASPREGILFQSLLERTVMIPRDFLMTAELAKGVGGFDESLAIYEDWDYKLRLAQQANFLYIHHVGIGYRRHGAGLSSASKAKHQRCRELIRRKYGIHGFHGNSPANWIKMITRQSNRLVRQRAA